MKNKKELSLIDQLFKPVDSSSLGLFRVLFGLILIIQSFVIFNKEYIQENFVQAVVHFPFPLFEILNLSYPSAAFTPILFLILGLSAVGITTGLFFRSSVLIFHLTFLYVFLGEKGLAVDSYYLVLLLTFLLIFTSAHRWPLLNELRLKKVKIHVIPFWQIFILRLQFILVYFFSSLSKLNIDWLLYAQPIRRTLVNKSLFGLTLDQQCVAYLFSYSGLLIIFSLSILLLFNRCKRITFSLIIFFNLFNHWFFEGDIGIFPFLMISAIPLFLEPDYPRKVLSKIISGKLIEESNPQKEAECLKYKDKRYQKVILCCIGVYILLQMLIPLRHWLYPGKSSWTYEGARFAWHLKLNAKKVNIFFNIVDPVSGKVLKYSQFRYLTNEQRWMDNIPDMLHQYVYFLKEEINNTGIENPQIYVHAQASLNNRPFQQYIDPTVDLANEKQSFLMPKSWIIPFEEKQPY